MIIFFRIPSESPNIRKISIALEEMGLPYVEKVVNTGLSDELDEEFVRISPNRTAPAILDTETGVTIFESAAILIYLAEKSGKFLPTESRKRAEVVQWLMFEAANVCPTMIELHHFLLNDTGEYPTELFERYKNRLEKYCTILDHQLENQAYLAGDFSIADIILFPWTVALEDMAEINVADYPSLYNWVARISSRQSIKQVETSSPENTSWCFQKGKVLLCSA